MPRCKTAVPRQYQNLPAIASGKSENFSKNLIFFAFFLHFTLDIAGVECTEFSKSFVKACKKEDASESDEEDGRGDGVKGVVSGNP